jgi:UDP-N-acetylmuramate dehydrogenase
VKKEDVLKDLHQYLLMRLNSQPISEKNSGCIFKNPTSCNPAGALIDRCGLKGKSIGGAEVSSLHANYINNTNNATFEDVIELIHEVQSIVKEKTGVDLEYEVRII